MQHQIQIHTEFNQNTDEWHTLRLGKITGSCFHKLLGTKAAAKKYLCDKANEIIIKDRCDRDKFEKLPMHMKRGTSWEDMARFNYEYEGYLKDDNFKVSKVGLIQLNDYVVCSPDGLVNDDGLIEIKVPDSNSFFWFISEFEEKGIKAIPKQHYQQMQFNLYVSGRKWCDYVLYNPKHENKESNYRGLLIQRVEPDPDLQIRIAGIVNTAPAIINEYIEQYYNIIGNK